MKVFVSLIIVLFGLGSLSAQAQKLNIAQLRNGDLIFQDLDCGPLCDAIEAVTLSYQNRHFSHLGLVWVDQDSIKIIEAIGTAVQATPLKKFLARSTKPMYVGRLKSEYQSLIPDAIQFAKAKIGVPYDEDFLMDNGTYYCSELIYEAFYQHEKPIFTLEPMTFKMPNSKDFFPVWLHYYANRKMVIPEGALGINPGGISRAPYLKMFKLGKVH